jgi:hypothetical protein
VLRVRVRREGYDLGAIIANLRETIRVGGEPAARTAWLAWTIGAAEGFQPAVDMREIFRSRARLAGLARRGQVTRIRSSAPSWSRSLATLSGQGKSNTLSSPRFNGDAPEQRARRSSATSTNTAQSSSRVIHPPVRRTAPENLGPHPATYPLLVGYLDVVVPRVSLNTRSTRLYGLLHPLQLEDRDLPSWNRVREDPGAKLFNFTVHRLSLVTG